MWWSPSLGRHLTTVHDIRLQTGHLHNLVSALLRAAHSFRNLRSNNISEKTVGGLVRITALFLARRPRNKLVSKFAGAFPREIRRVDRPV
jgi:hypothetical protein